ncbi:MAG: alkaline phosphatase family protein [bacterium]
MADRAIIFLIDGLDPEYLSLDIMPNIKGYIAAGAFTEEGENALPTLTNVNHVSLLTGTYPERHGITGNYHYDRIGGREIFMDDASFIKEKLVFELAREAGKHTALVTAKEKLTRLLNRGLDFWMDMSHYPSDLGEDAGGPPGIYTPEINLWTLNMAEEILRRENPDLMYVATTDYIEHKCAPGDPEMIQQIKDLDEIIGRIVGSLDLSRTLVVILADHGMRWKRRAVNLRAVLSRAGIPGRAIPTIKDGLYQHHRNLGGACYVYIEDPERLGEAFEVLSQTEGVEEVVPNSSAGRYRLPACSVGDFLVFAEPDYALGVWDGEEIARDVQDLRSHGSKHETSIPILLVGAGVRAGARLRDARNIDVIPTVAHIMGLPKGNFQGRILEEALV